MLLSLPVSAAGQTPVQQHIMSAAEQAQWPAIGLITYGQDPDGAICTGSLVAPDLVLTAAHCVAPDGIVMDPAIVQFRAGLRDGTAAATRNGTGILLAEGGKIKVWVMQSDMALVILDAPIDPELARPVRLRKNGVPQGAVDFIAYRRDARDKAQIAKGCVVRPQTAPLFGLGCAVVTGNSGAPVLQRGSEGWEIAGVIISHGSGQNGVHAVAVVPGEDLRRVIAQH